MFFREIFPENPAEKSSLQVFSGNSENEIPPEFLPQYRINMDIFPPVRFEKKGNRN